LGEHYTVGLNRQDETFRCNLGELPWIMILGVHVQAVQPHVRVHDDAAALDLVLDVQGHLHGVDRVVRDLERQVAVLREQKQELDQKLNNLIQIARENDHLHKRMQRITLALVEAHTPDAIFRNLQESLRDDFSAETVIINLFVEPENRDDFTGVTFVDRGNSELDVFRKFFDSRKPICGRLNKGQSQYLFGEQAEQIASAALLPICADECFGIEGACRAALANRDRPLSELASGILASAAEWSGRTRAHDDVTLFLMRFR